MFTLRPLTQENEHQYTSFLLQGVADHPECFRIDADDVRNDPCPLLSTASSDITFGACNEEGRLLGVASFAREKRNKSSHKALLYRMYVASGSANKGIGKALILRIIEHAKQLDGLESITLTVLAHNHKAKHLYTSLGFACFGCEHNAVKLGDIYFDEEHMARRL